MIKELFLKNFRGIKTGHLKDFSRINILLGPNNSGKSTILEALYLTSSMSKGEIIHKNNYLPGVIPEKDFLGYEPLIRLWGKHGILEWGKNPGIFEDGLIKVNINDKSWQISPYEKDEFQSPFRPKDEMKIGYAGINYTKKGLQTDELANEKKWLNIALTQKEIEKLPEKGRASLLWFQDFAFENEKVAVVATDGSKNFSNVLFFDLFTAMEHMKNQFVEDTLSSVPGWMDKIKERFNNIFPTGAFQITFVPIKAKSDLMMRAYIAPQGRVAISVDLLGDGARSIFKFICFLTALNDESIVLWEDPELFQHSETLERSLTEIVNIARDKNLQIFLCTQSYEVLGLFSTMIESGLLSSDEIRAFYTELKEGIFGYRPFTGENLLEWIKMELDPRKRNEFSGKLIYKLGEEK